MGACVRVRVVGGCLSRSLIEWCGVFVFILSAAFLSRTPVVAWVSSGCVRLKRSRAVRRRERVLVSLMSSCNHGVCVWCGDL